MSFAYSNRTSVNLSDWRAFEDYAKDNPQANTDIEIIIQDLGFDMHLWSSLKANYSYNSSN